MLKRDTRTRRGRDDARQEEHQAKLVRSIGAREEQWLHVYTRTYILLNTEREIEEKRERRASANEKLRRVRIKRATE